jgi:hypothetical protein
MGTLMALGEVRCRYDKVIGEGRVVRCEIVICISFTLLHYLGDRLEALESIQNSRIGD